LNVGEGVTNVAPGDRVIYTGFSTRSAPTARASCPQRSDQAAAGNFLREGGAMTMRGLTSAYRCAASGRCRLATRFSCMLPQAAWV
jgi:NADPH:quinone reductase-like Zn-dependent oxidoreductase